MAILEFNITEARAEEQVQRELKQKSSSLENQSCLYFLYKTKCCVWLPALSIPRLRVNPGVLETARYLTGSTPEAAPTSSLHVWARAISSS